MRATCRRGGRKALRKSDASEPGHPSPLSGRTLVLQGEPGKTRDQILAIGAVAGLIPNAITTAQYLAPTYGALGLTECLAALQATVAQVQGGDLGHAEAMLQAQSVALNAVFTSLAKRSAESEYMDHVERFLRLALKAQSQCRATLETLAVLKNPPVFTRQANITSGTQQINNGPVLNAPPARAEIQESEPIKLLEGQADEERMDAGTAGTTSASDQALEAVAAVHRPPHVRGKGPRRSKRLPRRRTPDAPRTRQRTQRSDPGATGPPSTDLR